LGDRPALTPSESAYQRMLARDPIEAAEQAQCFLKERTLADYYEEILKALSRWRGQTLSEGGSMNSRHSVSAIRFRKLSRIWTFTRIRKNARSTPEKEGALSKLEQLEKAAPLEAPQSPSPLNLRGAVLCVPGGC